MDLIVIGVIAGLSGTLVMDLMNKLLSRAGILMKIDIAMIGRMAAGWLRGRFRYNQPNKIKKVTGEILFGYITHYAIGISFALVYVFGWNLLIGGNASPLWAIVYGVATTAGAFFFILPSMGFGVLGRLSPEGIRIHLSSLINHLFYGMGIAIGIIIV